MHGIQQELILLVPRQVLCGGFRLRFVPAYDVDRLCDGIGIVSVCADANPCGDSSAERGDFRSSGYFNRHLQRIRKHLRPHGAMRAAARQARQVHLRARSLQPVDVIQVAVYDAFIQCAQDMCLCVPGAQSIEPGACVGLHI